MLGLFEPHRFLHQGICAATGKVEFPVIAAQQQPQPEFTRWCRLLHSFFYEEARRAFTSVAEQDPKCAMAQWGIAMTWWHPIWTPPTPDEMSAGKAAIDQGDENRREDGSRTRIHQRLECLLQHPRQLDRHLKLDNRVMVRSDRETASSPTKKR